ncbi:MAG: LacI family DNA-binding transcriptional regulator [Aggregatilineales bacterium]
MLGRKSMQRSGVITMRDVANLAGVSQSTVSRVLSKSPTALPISDDTHQKVMHAVAQLGYHPNVTARSLRTQRTNMIAVMIADISNPFYHFITRTIQDIAHQRHYDVLIANTDHRYEDERRFSETLLRRPVDGVVMVPYHLTNEEIGQLMDRTGIQVVALGQHVQHPLVDVVSADDGTATYDAVTWLIREKHHQRIALIDVTHTFPPGLRRWQAFCRALTDAGLPICFEYIQEGDFTHDSGYRAMNALLELSEPPTAVFALNDLMAIGAINAAQDKNIRIPDEVAVIGFDNIPAATYIRPTLTTVAQYPIEIGQKLATALFERIEERETGSQRTFVVPCHLIERQST